jgi:hypothetical protein
VERTGQVLELRAAQLTLNNGYRKFVVVNRSVTSEQHSTVAKGKMTIRMLKDPDASGKVVDASAVRAQLHPLLIGVGPGP